MYVKTFEWENFCTTVNVLQQIASNRQSLLDQAAIMEASL